MRDALSILGQLSKEENKITLETVINKVGSVSLKSIDKLLDYVENNQVDKLIAQINEYRVSALDYKLIIKKIIDVAVKKAKSIVETGKNYRLTFKDYQQIVLNLTDCLNKINVNVDAYSLIELVLLEYIKPGEKTEVKEKPVEKKSEPIVQVNNEWIDIRINNCFVDATKDAKLNAQEEWAKFVADIDTKKIKGIVIDSKVALASDKIYVILIPKHIVEEFNDNSSKISANYKKLTKRDVKLVGVDEDKWRLVSGKFVQDKKAGIKYEYIEEPAGETKTAIEKMATNLFDSDKIEVQ